MRHEGHGSMWLVHQIIERKKMLKTALYLERAAVVAGVCWAYLIIANENG